MPTPVVEGLARDGFDVGRYVPGVVTAARVDEAAYVVSFGCDLPEAIVGERHERWDDLPLVSDGFERARAVIVARVERLIATVARPA